MLALYGYLKGVGAAVLAAIAALSIWFGANGKIPMAVAICFIIAAGFSVLISVRLIAVMFHQRTVGLLYDHLDPDTFIKEYEPMLAKAQRSGNANLECTVRNYLSTGYAARGDFDQALSLLAQSPKTSEKDQPRADGLRLTNEANVYLLRGDLIKAEETILQLEKLAKSSPEEMGKDLPGNVYTLRVYLKALRGWQADIPFLIKMTTGSLYAYFRANGRYQLAIAQANTRRFEAARRNFQIVAKEAPKLFIAKDSLKRYEELKDRHGEDADIEVPEGYTKERITERSLLGRGRGKFLGLF